MFKYLAATGLLLLALASHAQLPVGGGPMEEEPTPVPLDGGASLLLAGGVAYGLKRLRQRRSV